MLPTTIEIRDSIIQVPTSSQQYPSVILFGLPKTGTTLLDNVFKMACSYLELGYFPLHGELFRRGLGSARESVLAPLSQVFVTQGYAYGTFRRYYSFITPTVLEQLNKIVIARDPKDMLVSDYFSMAYSHAIPGGERTQDNFLELRSTLRKSNVNQAILERLPDFVERIKVLRRAIPTDQLRVYQYEDIIFQKRSWIKDMMSFCQWPLTDEQIDKIIEAVDIFPKEENKYRHVRQVAPGNYKKYLNEETIEYIDQYLDLFLFKEYRVKQNGWRNFFKKPETLKSI